MLEGIARIMSDEASPVDQQTSVSSAVDIVIPVYANEGQVRACLSSVLAHHNESQGDIVVVNDCSPEPAIHQYLAALADQALITLLTNDQNEGFIVSCNRGAAVHPDNDFVLLNADTEVHGNWLDRMVSHVEPGAKVATVTPFSNNATIASYPTGATKPETDEDCADCGHRSGDGICECRFVSGAAHGDWVLYVRVARSLAYYGRFR